MVVRIAALPTDGAMPASPSRSVWRIERYCAPIAVTDQAGTDRNPFTALWTTSRSRGEPGGTAKVVTAYNSVTVQRTALDQHQLSFGLPIQVHR